jgi:L-ribulose-5-phosphate 3-epimerase
VTLPLDRRSFLTTSAVAVAAGLGVDLKADVDQAAGAAPATGPAVRPQVFKTKIHKALIQQKPTEDSLRQLKEAGFDGLEAGILSPEEAEKVRAAADKLGLRVHSVLRGWAAFNSANQSEVDQSFALTESAIRAAQAFGADAVLTVPCRINAMTRGGFGQKDGILMPRPWEFQIDFDRKTGHVTRVVSGDNAPYADYIKAQNHATDTSTAMVKRLIPLAEKARVIVALENVWNHLWVTPALFKHFVESFQSPWVRAYYDIGNHVKYGPPEEWILALGALIVKIHVKDFRLNPADPDGQGSFVNSRDGSVRWPIIRTALDEVGYNGWMTIEGGTNITMAEHSQRLDLILAGQ